jgi:hypothetical protein
MCGKCFGSNTIQRVVDYHFPQRFLHLLPLGDVYARTDVAHKVCFALGGARLLSAGVACERLHILQVTVAGRPVPG